jgi:hypothetical protein
LLTGYTRIRKMRIGVLLIGSEVQFCGKQTALWAMHNTRAAHMAAFLRTGVALTTENALIGVRWRHLAGDA